MDLLEIVLLMAAAVLGVLYWAKRSSRIKRQRKPL
jgi:hypothetical protein